jgi:glycosyltransferase involved in cell wall biosynthesis
LADAIIVHCAEMRQHLIRLGVQAEKIHIVLHGTHLPAPPPFNYREDMVFYGGHKLMSGKGFETLLQAMSILQGKMAASTPLLKIHGHYGTTIPEGGLQLAAQHGVADKIVWLNQIPDEETVRLYQHSLLCVLPYTGSFAGFAASLAAACQLPIVCTRKAGLPDHLGETGVWVEENNPSRRQLGNQLLKRAETFLSWDVIADQTLKIYEESIDKKTGAELEPSNAESARAV